MAEPAFSDSFQDDSIEPRYDPAKVAGANFDTVRRGFNEAQVRKFLGDLAVGLRNAYRTEDELRGRTDELVNRLAEADGVDEVTLIERLGEQASSLLKSARTSAKLRTDEADEHADQVVSNADEHALSVRVAADEAATDTVAQANSDAAVVIADATEASDSMRAEASGLLALRTKEAEVEVAKRLQGADDHVAAAHMQAEHIIAEAKQEGRVMIIEVQRHREQLLQNIERRRRRTQVHVERLQAGRDRLVQAYDAVQQGVDSARAEINVSGSSAKIASDRAARQFEAATPRTVHELEDDLFVAKAAGLLGLPDDIAAEAAAQANESAPVLERPVVAEPEVVVEEIVVEEVVAVKAEPTLVVDEVIEIEPEAEEPTVEEPVVVEPVAIEIEPEAEEPVAVEAPVVAEPVVEVEAPELKLVEEPPAESLFDRLRAERAEATAAAEEVLAELAESVASPEIVKALPVEIVSEPEATPEVLVSSGLPLADREECTAPMTAGAARSIKRALADAQNEVLDALRTGDEQALAQPLLGMRQAMHIALAESWAEGANYVGRAGDPTDAAVGPILDAFTHEVLEPLRSKFAASLTSQQPVETVRAHSRTLRSQLNGLANRAVTAAFQAGIVDTLPAGCPVRWVSEVDCDHGAQNADADGRLGGSFPSGLSIPAPMGECACLVVPIHQ